MHSDVFTAHAAALPPHSRGPIEMHDLGCDAGRCRPARHPLDRVARVAGLLFQLAPRGLRGVIVSLIADEPGRPVDHTPIDRAPELFGEDQFPVIGDGDDSDGFFRLLALDEFPAVTLTHHDVFSVENGSALSQLAGIYHLEM